MLDPSLRKSLGTVAVGTGLLLLVPLIAMQFTSEVDWGPGDFVVAACLLFIAGTGMALAWRHTMHTAHRVVLVGLLALALATVWGRVGRGPLRLTLAPRSELTE